MAGAGKKYCGIYEFMDRVETLDPSGWESTPVGELVRILKSPDYGTFEANTNDDETKWNKVKSVIDGITVAGDLNETSKKDSLKAALIDYFDKTSGALNGELGKVSGGSRKRALRKGGRSLRKNTRKSRKSVRKSRRSVRKNNRKVRKSVRKSVRKNNRKVRKSKKSRK